MIELLERFGITPDDLSRADWVETIRLKAAPDFRRRPKRLLGYTDTAETNRMRDQLADLNAHLRGFQIDLEVDDIAAEVNDGEDEPDEDNNFRDRSAMRLYRVFNNGRWDHGGRFYGGWWQALPKVARQRLLIDGEETVELGSR